MHFVFEGWGFAFPFACRDRGCVSWVVEQAWGREGLSLCRKIPVACNGRRWQGRGGCTGGWKSCRCFWWRDMGRWCVCWWQGERGRIGGLICDWCGWRHTDWRFGRQLGNRGVCGSRGGSGLQKGNGCSYRSLFGDGSTAPTFFWKFTFIYLFPLPAPFVLFLATLLFFPGFPFPSLSPFAPTSLNSIISLPPSTPPFPLGSLQFTLNVVQILCRHSDTVKLLQQSIQGGEESPQRSFRLCSLSPAVTSHHHSWAKAQSKPQAKSQADTRGFCEAAGAGRRWTPRGLRASINTVWGRWGVWTVQRRQAQGLAVAGRGWTGRWELHTFETHFVAKLRRKNTGYDFG